MDKREFKIKTYIRSGIKEVDDYIDELTQYLISFEADNVVQLILATDDMAGIIVSDMKKISKGETDKLLVLTDDSKTFDKFQKIVEKIDSWKKVSDIAKSLRPEIQDHKEEEVIKLPKGSNPFESITKQKFNSK